METASRPVWVYDDGGRAQAGFKGKAGDCAVRAVAIATNLPYKHVYDTLEQYGLRERRSARRARKSHPQTGIYTPTMRRYLADLGWEWTPTMGIGTGCTVHVTPKELPAGRVILALSRHYAAAINGIVYDTHDSTRDGTRCVYGYWSKD